MPLPLVLLIAALVVALLKRALPLARISRQARTVATYELEGAGGLELDADTARPLGEGIVTSLLSPSTRRTPAGMAITRAFDGERTRCYLTLYGVGDKKAREILLGPLKRELRATATPVPAAALPTVSEYFTSTRQGREGRERMGSITAWSDDAVGALVTSGTPGFVTVGVEAMTPREVRAHKAWIARSVEAEGDTATSHPQFMSNKLVRARFIAGVETGGIDQARALISSTANYLPGYDCAIGTSRVDDRRSVPVIVAVGATAAALLASTPVLAIPVACVTFAAAVSVTVRSINTAQSRLDAALEHGFIPVEAPSLWRLLGLVRRAKQFAFTVLASVLVAAGKRAKASDKSAAAYRWGTTADRLRKKRPAADMRPSTGAVLAPAQTIAVLIAPTAYTATSSANATLSVSAPAAVRAADGTLIGYDTTGAPCRIPDRDRQHGIYSIGSAGTGKSRLLGQIFAEDVAARLSGVRAGRTTQMVLDVKGDGAFADACELLATAAGDQQVLRFDMAAKTGPQIQLLDPARPAASVAAFVEAFAYALDEGSIKGASKAVLSPLITLALIAATDESAETGRAADPMAFAWTLLGKEGATAQAAVLDRLAQATVLAAAPTTLTFDDEDDDLDTVAPDPVDEPDFDDDLDALLLLAGGPGATQPAAPAVVPAARPNAARANGHLTPTVLADLNQALREWESYTTMTKRDQADTFRAPANKVQTLIRYPQLWSIDPARRVFPLAALLESHRCVLINFEVEETKDATTEAFLVTLSTLFTHLLWSEAKSTCANWQDQGRAVTLYCDELSSIAGDVDSAAAKGASTNIVAQMKDRGRAMGLRLTFATQRSEQLPKPAADAMKDVGNQIYLRLTVRDIATAAITQLVGDATDAFSVDDLCNLDVGHAIAKFIVNDKPVRTPFSLTIADYQQRPEWIAAARG